MEHLTIRFDRGLPRSIQRVGGKGTFTIPKDKRLKTLQFMNKHPEHVLKKRKSSWEVLGIAPQTRQRGGNRYNGFLKDVKRVLMLVPDHPLSTLPLVELQKQPQVKALYERHFKNNPELINYQSILNAVTSNLLNYDASTGQVRESIADVRSRRKTPTSTVPLNVIKDSKLDRQLLLVLEPDLTAQAIPTAFLKSSYFTLRSDLQQLYQQDPSHFRSEVERLRREIMEQVLRDYAVLVNRINRLHLARYPFEAMALQHIGHVPSMSGYSAYKGKLAALKQLAFAVPGSTGTPFQGLADMIQAYSHALESQLMNPDHFMYGIQKIMTNDRDFTLQILRNGNRSHTKVAAILKGNSL